MATLDEPFIKPHAIQTLEGTGAAPNIDDDFDAVWDALEQLRATVNINASTTTTVTTSGGTDDAFAMAVGAV